MSKVFGNRVVVIVVAMAVAMAGMFAAGAVNPIYADAAEENSAAAEQTEETVNVHVVKKSRGEESSPVIIKLMADGVEQDRIALNKGNRYEYDFKNLPKYQTGSNVAIHYSTEEERIGGESSNSIQDGPAVANTEKKTTEKKVVNKVVKKDNTSQKNTAEQKPVQAQATNSVGTTPAAQTTQTAQTAQTAQAKPTKSAQTKAAATVQKTGAVQRITAESGNVPQTGNITELIPMALMAAASVLLLAFMLVRTKMTRA